MGRFIGSAVLRLVSPGKVLAFNALGAIALILVSANTGGAVSGCSLLAIGLMNSIMFPTIFTLGGEGLGSRAADGSGVICVAIVGGAVIPPLTGLARRPVGQPRLRPGPARHLLRHHRRLRAVREEAACEGGGAQADAR